MKRLAMVVPLFFLGFYGVAHAENVYDMKYQGYLLKAQFPPPILDESGPSGPITDPIPVAQISNDNLTFSGDAYVLLDNPYTFNPSTCCSVNLGNQGGFTVSFDQPVNSVVLSISALRYSYIDLIEDIGSTDSTVSAVYKNSEGAIVGQSSVTASWLGVLYDDNWQWNNTFNGHESAFGVSNVEGFSEITFMVDGGYGGFSGKGFSFSAPLSLGSTELYYSYINPVPEPETYAMLLSGLGLLGFLAKRRKKAGLTAV